MSRFFNVSATHQRLTTSVSGGRTIEDWQTQSTITVSRPQPGNEELIAVGNGHFYNTHTIYCDDSVDVRIGDRLVIDTIIYSIQGVQLRNYGNARINHKQLGVISE